MSTPLMEAIDRLYDEFASHSRPRSIDYCSCCFTPSEEQELLAPVRLRSLPMEALRPYAADVMLTVGGAADLRYFLPRIIEVATLESFLYPDLEGLIGRLPAAEWSTWPQPEQDAVRAYFHALWADALFSAEPAVGVGAALCAIGNAEDDLTPYLTRWTDSLDRASAVQALREFVEHDCRLDRHGRLRPTNAYWAKRAAAPVVDWLGGAGLRSAVAARLTADLHSATDGETRQALEWLTWALPVA